MKGTPRDERAREERKEMREGRCDAVGRKKVRRAGTHGEREEGGGLEPG